VPEGRTVTLVVLRGTSLAGHEMALRRIELTGGKMISVC